MHYWEGYFMAAKDVTPKWSDKKRLVAKNFGIGLGLAAYLVALVIRGGALFWIIPAPKGRRKLMRRRRTSTRWHGAQKVSRM